MATSQASRTRYGIEYVGEVVESRPLTPSCHGIKVERHEDFDYLPVQFTFLSLRTADEEEPWGDYRAMSLASAPTRPHLEYGVRLSDSAWKRAFQALEPGDQVMVEGPVGHFVLDETRPAVFVAGGIGITPLKGMAEYAADTGLDQPVRLVYTNRTAEEIAYKAELDELARTNPHFEVTYTLTREEWSGRTGRIDAALLDELAGALDDPAYYLCGTPGMVEDMVRALEGLGVDGERVLYEEFWGY